MFDEHTLAPFRCGTLRTNKGAEGASPWVQLCASSITACEARRDWAFLMANSLASEGLVVLPTT